MKNSIGKILKKFSYIFILVLSLNVNSQNMINPYLDYNTFSPTIIQSLNYGAPNITSPPFLYDWSQPPINGGYTGEYMITMQDHFWRIAYPNNALSYKVEVVGFPFTMSCWDQPQSCAYPISPLSTRDMYMPDDSYNSVTKKWNNLVNVRSNGEFTGDIGGSFIPEVLVSKFFLNAVVFNLPSRNILPHTVTKHTIYLHCGSSTNGGVISQFSFYYDNTRGRMRNYPFEKDNAPGSTSSSFWDVIFRPELMIAPVSLFHNTDKYFFDEPNNSDWINGGSINYFPLAENNADASCNIIAPLSSDEFAQLIATYSGQPQDFNYFKHFAPPYSLYDVTLRCTYGNLLAGYQLVNGLLSYQTNSSAPGIIYEGLRHTYHIDQNIDLTIINPNEKTIYNPSEVDVTASDLHFPSYYTFKTIRGVYPSIANVTADNNDPQTGGPYADPRDVPVRTDLRSENANDPQDPNTPWHSVYASRYYLKEGSKLTIEPCVNIFDATFDVEEGATLLFEIQQYNLGFEHKNLNQTQNLGRYKIKGLGGAILRNYNHTQYVQNGIITQPYKLHYKATSTILSGATVAAIVDDDDQLPGNYSIEPGGDVQFTAPDLISLRDGFSAKTGCTFKAKCEDPGLLPDCPQQLNGNGGSKIAPQFAQQNKTNASSGIIIPNPSNGIFTYRTINFSPENTASIEVINSMGIKLISKMIDDENTNFDISQYGKGVYYLRAMNGKNVRVEKVVVK